MKVRVYNCLRRKRHMYSNVDEIYIGSTIISIKIRTIKTPIILLKEVYRVLDVVQDDKEI